MALLEVIELLRLLLIVRQLLILLSEGLSYLSGNLLLLCQETGAHLLFVMELTQLGHQLIVRVFDKTSSVSIQEFHGAPSSEQLTS